MKTSRISLNQFLTLLVLFLSSSASLVNVGRFSGRDVWIVILISTVFGGLLFTIYYRISKLHGFQSLTEIIRDLFGKWIGGLIILAYMGYFLFLATGLLKSTSDMIKATIMIDANLTLVITLLMIPIVYGLILGVNVIGRSSELLFYVVGICFIPLLIAVFTSDIFKFENLLPVLEKGLFALKTDIYTISLFPYGEALAFLFLFPLIPNDKKGKILKYGYVGITLAMVILLGIDVMNIGILGADLTENFVYPFFNAMKMVGVSVVFERVDPLSIIILMTTCFFKISIYCYAGLSCLEKIVVRFNYRQLAIPIGILLIFGATKISSNRIENLYRAIIENPKGLLPIFQLAIPGLIWIMSEFKYRKHPKDVKTEASN